MRRITLGGLIAAWLACPGVTTAQEFPVRSISFVAAAAPGTPVDILARTLAPGMSQNLGQTVVVDNRVGAGSLIGYEYAAKRPPDGYTIAMVSTVQLASLPVSVKDLRFDALKDLPPFIGLGEGKVILCATKVNVPWTNFKDMVTYYRANPGKLNFGVSAPNTVLLAHSLMKDINVQGTVVPYSSAAPLFTDLMAGTNHVVWVGETAVPTIAARVQLLGVSGNNRSAQYPTVPTFAELGLPNIPGLGYSINAPAGTPANVLARLHRAVSHAMSLPDVKARFAQLQLEIEIKGAEGANRDFQAQAKLFGEVAARVGYKPQ